MKLNLNGQELKYIDIDSERVPCTLLVKLDKTYRFTFSYNEQGGFFTVNLELSASGKNTPLVFGEILRYGKPLFEAFNDERYPLPVICPLCFTGDDIEEITYQNFGSKVRLYLFDRPQSVQEEIPTITQIDLLISSTEPANNETDVWTVKDIVINFNQTVTGGAGKVQLYNSSDELVEEWTGSALDIDGSRVTINPTNAFAYGAGYYILIEDTAFYNLSGMNFAGYSASTDWGFGTETELLISSLFPVNGSTGISITVNPTLNFNQNVYAGDGKIRLYTDFENQISNPDFNGTDGWYAYGGTLAVSNGSLELTEDTNTSEHYVYQVLHTFFTPESGHKYYMSCEAVNNGGRIVVVNLKADNTWEVIYGERVESSGRSSCIINITSVFSTPNFAVRAYSVYDSHLGDGSKYYYKNFCVVDITEVFGAGQEPTVEQCDILFTNNAIKNPQFDDGTINWTAGQSSISVSNNILTNEADGAQLYGATFQVTGLAVEVGHKLYVNAKMRVTNSDCIHMDIVLIDIGGEQAWVYLGTITEPTANQWYDISDIYEVPAGKSGIWRYQLGHFYTVSSNGKAMEVDGATFNGPVLLDLTEIFGAGNEPTKEECDAMFFAGDCVLLEQIAAANATFNGAQALLNPAKDLPPGKDIYIKVDGDAFENKNGTQYEGISDFETWKFTTS